MSWELLNAFLEIGVIFTEAASKARLKKAARF
jgi:hypothetical protein